MKLMFLFEGILRQINKAFCSCDRGRYLLSCLGLRIQTVELTYA